MKITSVKLIDVRGFSDLTIDFGESSPSVLITGDNGDGKTTVLRAIAIGLSDSIGASALLSDLPGEFIRYGKDEAKIVIQLKVKSNKRYRITTVLRQWEWLERVTQKYHKKEIESQKKWKEINPEKFPWNELFGTGYGAGLRILGKERYQHYYLTDAVYSLFKNDVMLQEQEVAYKRLLDSAAARAPKKAGDKTKARKKAESDITDCLRKVLNIPLEMKISLRENGIFFGPEKAGTELSAMGDGVQAVTTLLLDLMSWWYLYLNDRNELLSTNAHDTKQYSGIVLIDEAEKHLHPSWQREIVASLLDAFPNVQFVMSTHAPLCVSGATDFDPNKIFLFRTQKVEDNTISGHRYELPRGYRADQVLTSEAFGLLTSLSPVVGDLLKVIEELYNKKNKSAYQKTKLRKLIAELDHFSPQTSEQEQDWRTQQKLLELTEQILAGSTET